MELKAKAKHWGNDSAAIRVGQDVKAHPSSCTSNLSLSWSTSSSRIHISKQQMLRKVHGQIQIPHNLDGDLGTAASENRSYNAGEVDTSKDTWDPAGRAGSSKNRP